MALLFHRHPMARLPFDDFFDSPISFAPPCFNWEFKSPRNSSAHTRETEDAFHLRVEMPGVPKENVKVTLDDGLLKISGEQQTTIGNWGQPDSEASGSDPAREPEGASANAGETPTAGTDHDGNDSRHHNVRTSGHSTRSFSYQYRLPRTGVDSSNIQARLNNGLLEVSVPKIAPPEPKTISITV